MSGSGITKTFAELRAADRAGFIPFIMAGDPNLDASLALMQAAVDAGADLIEVGVPFSDPMADGPALQRSAQRALEAGTTLTGVLGLLARFRETSSVPVILFGYANPFLFYGAEALARDAHASGADGVLCVDIPPEEADDLQPACASAGLDMIFLLTPTSDRRRIARVKARAHGFIYYVSITGTTGAGAPEPDDIAAMITKVRASIDLPIGVGFGITTPTQAAAVARVADAVVVGSAVMRIVEEHAGPALIPTVSDFFAGMATAVHDARL